MRVCFAERIRSVAVLLSHNWYLREIGSRLKIAIAAPQIGYPTCHCLIRRLSSRCSAFTEDAIGFLLLTAGAEETMSL